MAPEPETAKGRGAELSSSHEARKLVTVLFCDLEGSTALGELLDIESLRALLLEFFDSMTAVIEEWDGSVQKYIGDAVVAVFGVPVTREDDGVRAIRAGLDMHERLSVINPSLIDHYGVELAMRIGINTGEVLAGTDTTALLAGDVFNVAARLEAVAESGTVVVSERTYHATEGSFEFASLGEFVLKGKHEPQAAWRVESRRLGVEHAFETEMVGRDAELGMLNALMAQAIAGGKPRLVTIVGETGIGKSRLVREFLAQESGRLRTLFGRCLPYGHGITFWPLREVLWESAGIAMDDTSEVAGSKLRSLVNSLPTDSVADPHWMAFALATTSGIAMPDNPFDKLSPESAGEELQLAWPAFFSALASGGPTVLVIEDIHWAERPLLDMIEQLALRASGPLLVVATARPAFIEEGAGWAAKAIPSQIGLGPLMGASFSQMASQLLPEADEELRHRLLDSAGGNPFFAEEIARHAFDVGMDGALGGQIFVPDTARAVLAARIDQLDPFDRETLEDAAVVGEVFWPAPLEQIRDDSAAASLAALERAGFVTTKPVTSLPGQREMSFRHGLMRDVAYQSISRRRLASMHAAVAVWTETLAADRREEFIEVIAHHYATAAQPEIAALGWRDEPQEGERIRVKAIGALVEAGDAARRRFSIDQAVEYGDRALALATTERERLTALELKAASYHAAARVDEAWPIYEQAIAVARSIGDDADISRVTTDATLLWARYSGAFTIEDWKPAAIDIVQTRLREIGETEETLELAALLLGRARWHEEFIDRTPEGAKADAERALAISEGLDSERLLSHALDVYEQLVSAEGFCELGTLADRMVKLGSEMVDHRQAHEMLITSAVALAEIGRYEDSRQVGTIAHARAQTMGVHLRIHGIAALTAHMVPSGAFSQIVEASDDLLGLIAADGGVACSFGRGALGGRALALFEEGRRQEGLDVVEFCKAAVPHSDRVSVDELQLIERVRPFVGLERAERLLSEVQDLSTSAHHMYAVRARLPLAVLRMDSSETERLIVMARELATRCCAPQMLAFADWAASVRDGAAPRVQAALATLNEPYTAARLAADYLGMITDSQAADLRATTQKALESMGAKATLAELGAS